MFICLFIFSMIFMFCQWGVLGGGSPEVDNNLLRLLHVEREIVVSAPLGQLAHLFPVVRLIVVVDEPHQSCRPQT